MKLITQVTRRRIFDTITVSKVLWEGRPATATTG
jgi:hypothetical protein